MSHEDILRLNALVDGELAPAERAAMAARLAHDRDLARAYATLARLKAVVGELVDDEMTIAPHALNRRPWQLGAAALAACVLIAVLAWEIYPKLPSHSASSIAAIEPTEINFASLPAGMTIPKLDSTGLKLTGFSYDAESGQPLVSATYRGPHGCRLDLRVFHAETQIAPAPGATSRHRWEVDGIGYELTAYGMPPWRFAIVADAAEWQARHVPFPAGSEQRLREARLSAPPCSGAG